MPTVTTPFRKQSTSALVAITFSLVSCQATPAEGPDRLSETSWFDTPSSLDPRGIAAYQIAELWWFIFATAALVFVVVLGLFLYALFRPGQAQVDGKAATGRGTMVMVVAGAGLTAAILIVVFVVTLRNMAVLAGPSSSGKLTFEVVGQQWWWDIRYEGEVITANEIHIPVGETVRLRLISDNVIHSFWVPQLQGKMDLVPGHTNTFWLRADAPGVYRGQCAEFCGIQHAKMAFFVVAESPQDFAAWLERMRQPAPEPSEALAQEGRQVFLTSACAGCHSIRGTEAAGKLGPDLTHLGSRLSLAAGTLLNTPGNLEEWISHPQAIKPGNAMPEQNLSAGSLEALVAYLESLD